MKRQIFDSEKLAAEYVVAAIETIVAGKPDALLCLAAGHSSLPVFAHLIEAAEQKRICFDRVSFVGLDEWLGVSAKADGSCASFLHKNLFDPLHICPEQICLFNGTATDPVAECARIEDYIEHRGGIDYILLGMGMNGHLALNEPGDSFRNGAHITDLDATTKSVAPKYFSADMPPLEHGITLGIQNIIKSSLIHLTVFGEHKKSAVGKLFTTEIHNDFPASILKNCEHAVLILDQMAYAKSLHK